MKRNFVKNLPEKFVGNTLGLCGDSGGLWLNDLPHIIESLSENWQIKVDKPFENLSYNFVAPCICADDSEAVVKIAVPLNNSEIFNEAKYLQILDGKGTVKVLNFDKERRAMLLEKLSPGKHLKEIFVGNEQAAVEVAAVLIRKLRRKPSACSEFILLEVWFENFFKRALNTEFPQEYLRKTQEIFYEFNNSSPKFLLHGDLHHENILSAERESFLAIDPKGIIGEIGFETSAFLNNHLDWLADDLNLHEKLIKAVAHFSESFEIKPRDLYKWAFAQMVLAVWWTFEDGGQHWREELWRVKIWEEILEAVWKL